MGQLTETEIPFAPTSVARGGGLVSESMIPADVLKFPGRVDRRIGSFRSISRVGGRFGSSCRGVLVSDVPITFCDNGGPEDQNQRRPFFVPHPGRPFFAERFPFLAEPARSAARRTEEKTNGRGFNII